MKFLAEFVTDREHAGRIAQRAAHQVEVVKVAPDGEKSRVSIVFDSPDHYDARTLALAVQGARPVVARIRRDAPMFPGRWFDLNED